MSHPDRAAQERRLIELAGPDRYAQAVRLAEKSVDLPPPAVWVALYLRLFLSELVLWSVILAGGLGVALFDQPRDSPMLLGTAILAALAMTVYRLIRLVEAQDCARDLITTGKLCEHLLPIYRRPLDIAIRQHLAQMNVPVANSNDPVGTSDRNRRRG
ncbi:hypothetical protein ACFPL7_14910 [Dongia soli]|uniref:Uncharacterized protein n=1 Tax=Dongia soli TaxID=600628 RepID=A0ABU5EBQ6_9PROT|nr:hypothetical protein [Dongia soli]MDY0883813.1 hypothetical protein [Dongia soli]